jgi:nitrate/TMAO reductase-like tetraheme cytochrome c subunit
MKRLRSVLRSFLFPPPGTPLERRLLPYASLGAMSLVLLVSVTYAWDYTNSSAFCGTSCHTMPPEYTAYLVSPHARVQCVECHIGRDFVATQISRKAGDIKHIVSLAFKQYEYPITADELRPARETCERCHYPAKFSSDSLRELRQSGDDPENSATSIYLVLKTGGGTRRQGLGRGIHWHIENRIVYYPTGPAEQEIPYVRVYNEDGTITEYVDVAANFDRAGLQESSLKEMDCITCHNRITHLVNTPEASLDIALARQLISRAIPEIHTKGVEVLRGSYQSEAEAFAAIARLAEYYRTNYPDYYAANTAAIETAVEQIQTVYRQSVFLEQKSDWNAHPNNVGHKDFPGCFRCHDGKHLDPAQQAIRLECNLCHSIPVVAASDDFVTNIEISRGPEPESHLNANWIGLHRTYFDDTCALCHDTGNPGGTDNSSFCSNSACHGASWDYAGLDAPGISEILAAQLPTPQPTPTGSATVAPPAGPPTYNNAIQAIFLARCGACHGETPAAGLDVTTYKTLMSGSENGPVIVPGAPDESRLVEVQQDRHFRKLNAEELQLVIDWIDYGAPE